MCPHQHPVEQVPNGLGRTLGNVEQSVHSTWQLPCGIGSERLLKETFTSHVHTEMTSWPLPPEWQLDIASLA